MRLKKIKLAGFKFSFVDLQHSLFPDDMNGHCCPEMGCESQYPLMAVRWVLGWSFLPHKFARDAMIDVIF